MNGKEEGEKIREHRVWTRVHKGMKWRQGGNDARKGKKRQVRNEGK